MKRNEKLNGYKNYLVYKKVLERFGKGDCGKREIAEYVGSHMDSTSHIIKILKKENVIKVKSFEINSNGRKRMIYTLVDNH